MSAAGICYALKTRTVADRVEYGGCRGHHILDRFLRAGIRVFDLVRPLNFAPVDRPLVHVLHDGG